MPNPPARSRWLSVGIIAFPVLIFGGLGAVVYLHLQQGQNIEQALDRQSLERIERMLSNRREGGGRDPGFDCRSCGRHHDELPMSFGPDAPLLWNQLSEQERASKGKLEQEWCIIGDDAFFIRGCLEIPVKDGPGPFIWIVWVSLSKSNFERARKLWNDPARVAEPPYFGWLSSSLPGYPEQTIHLKTHVHTRKVGERPSIELEQTDHPLAVEQRDGMTMARVRQLAEISLHGK